MDDPAKTHPVHATLEQIDSLAKSSQLSDLNTEIDDTRRQALDRIFFVVEPSGKGRAMEIGCFEHDEALEIERTLARDSQSLGDRLRALRRKLEGRHEVNS